MNNTRFAIPGLMIPHSPNFKSKLVSPVDGSLLLCIHIGALKDVVYYSIALANGLVINDPSYPFLNSSDSSKALYPQLAYTSTVLPSNAIIPCKIVNGIAIPIDELCNLPQSDRVFWLLNLPPGLLVHGCNTIEAVVNGVKQTYTVNRPYSTLYSLKDSSMAYKGLSHQDGETFDVAFNSNVENTILINMSTCANWDLVKEAPLRASTFINGVEDPLDTSLNLETNILSIKVPPMPPCSGTWKCEFLMFDSWMLLSCGDIVIV